MAYHPPPSKQSGGGDFGVEDLVPVGVIVADSIPVIDAVALAVHDAVDVEVLGVVGVTVE
jgi:hypothetical protein